MALRGVVARLLLWACTLPVFYLQAEDLEPADQFQGKTVQAIRFEPLTQPVKQAELARLLPLHEGSTLTLADVRAAIKKLYTTGLYSNIEFDAEPAANGLTVVIRTTEQWFVGPVEVTGQVSSPPNEGELANATRLELGTPFSDDDLNHALDGIRKLLERNGFYVSGVTPKIERDAEHQEVALTFTVHSGKRAHLDLPEVTGDTRLPPEKLEKSAKYKSIFRRWKPATEENSERGLTNIRKKYESADRLTADVTLKDQQYVPSKNQVHNTIEADGGPKVKIVSQGAKISKGKLKKYVPVSAEETLNRDVLVRGVRNLRDYFQNAGYFDVSVDFQTTQSADQENITYVVGLGERQKLVRVAVEGNHYFRTQAIRERMFLQPSGFIRLRHGRFSEGFISSDKDAITALYQDNGFQDVKVTFNPMKDYQGKKGDLAVTVVIEEGPQYKVKSLQVNGVDLPNRTRILSQLASITGEPFSKTNVALDRDYLLNVYQSSGYPDVSFDWRMAPGADPAEVNLVYFVTPGKQRFIRDVLITGVHHTSHRLIDPNIILKPGEPLSWTEMGVMQRRLYDLGVFDKVDMAIQNPNGDTDDKYVLFHITEGHRYYTAVGFGAELAQIGGSPSSLSAPGGQTGFAPEGSLQVSRLNLWGLGHSLNFKGNYSTLDRQVSLNYLMPRYRNVEGRNISITALYDNQRDVRTFTARRLEGDVQLSQKLSKSSQLQWRYSWRNIEVDQNTLKINPLLIPLESQPANIGMLATSFIQDRRDNSVDAHRGIYNTVDLGLAYKYFGGNKDFMRVLARNSYYKPLFGQWVFAINTQFGWIHPFNVTPGVSGADYIPIPERFFGGGTNSMRGFPDYQAGPRDLDTGFPLGGNALFFNQDELRFPFIGDNITGVIFHDMGNIFTDLSSMSFRFHQNSPTDFNYTIHAVGFGIRYKTPVGPVRVDLAYSINAPQFYGLVGTYQQLLGLVQPPPTRELTGINHFQFFISIGQAF
jgi:outer membrane protein insertion porin family